jgi:CheY-like chemotaxis protein
MVVGTAGDGGEALAVLAADPAITVAFTDIRMPRLDGLGLANRVLEAGLAQMETPLALTGETPPELARILSHELRTPLIPIIALPDMMDAQASLPPGALNAYPRGRATGRNPALAHLRGPDRVPRPAGRTDVHLAAGFAAEAARPVGGALPADGSGGRGNVDDWGNRGRRGGNRRAASDWRARAAGDERGRRRGRSRAEGFCRRQRRHAIHSQGRSTRNLATIAS